VTCAALVPFALAVKARHSKSDKPRIHIIQDMDSQPKYKAQRENRSSPTAAPIAKLCPATVAVGHLNEDDHFYRGRVGNGWAALPAQVELSEETMARGKQRFGIYCTPCTARPVWRRHGAQARRGPVARCWIQPSNMTQEYLRLMSVASCSTPSPTASAHARLRPQIPPEDRWRS